MITDKVIYEDNDSIMFAEVTSFFFLWEQGEYLWNLYLKGKCVCSDILG